MTMRWGIAGTGRIASDFARDLANIADAQLVAVGSRSIDSARTFASARNIPRAHGSVADLAQDPEVDVVYVAGIHPVHREHAIAMMRAGKHVLVEKPLATTLDQARELERLAAERSLVCVANLLERYCPLAETVRRLRRSRLLGDLIHGLFINEAADEGLGPGHWFWDRSVSGGIFVEHGVHFFDLVASWLGQGRVVSAARSVRRPAGPVGDGGGGCEEQVLCTCRYPADHGLTLPGESASADPGILFHFEHGFHQASLLDRQEMRLVFERGEVRLFDWVPTHGTVRALVDDEAAAALMALLPGATARVVERVPTGRQVVRGRFRDWPATAVIEIEFSPGGDKMAVYGAAVRELAADQIARIRDPAHARRLTEADSVAAVALAVEADRLARASD